MTAFRQRWQKGTRYYQVEICLDLWGQWMLVQQWGRCGTRLGQARHLWCASYAEALTHWTRIARRRQQHGYCLSDPRNLK